MAHEALAKKFRGRHETGRACARCGNPNNTQRCGRCFRVFYCSKDCQRADWRQHREVCLAVVARTAVASEKKDKADVGGEDMNADTGSENTDCAQGKKTEVGENETGDGPKCKNCQKTSPDLKTCGHCGKASYCSKDCQRQNWSQHKRLCKQFAKSKTQSDWEAGKMFEDLMRSMDPNQLSTKRCSPRPALTWKQAVQKVRKLHPDKTVITDLRNVMEEEDLDPDLMTSTVFLACLDRPHPYIVRHAWYLKDQKGEEVRIFFYLDHDTPAPYFQWRDLDCGNFLCLEHAYIHTFLDGTTGIRVDDACDVSVIGA